jgi:hypothetical protein
MWTERQTTYLISVSLPNPTKIELITNLFLKHGSEKDKNEYLNRIKVDSIRKFAWTYSEKKKNIKHVKF